MIIISRHSKDFLRLIARGNSPVSAMKQLAGGRIPHMGVDTPQLKADSRDIAKTLNNLKPENQKRIIKLLKSGTDARLLQKIHRGQRRGGSW